MFLVLFIGIPITPLIIYTYLSLHPDKKYILKGILVLCGLAFVYTTPWDNYILSQKVWWYGEDRILGVIGYVPIEEYTFFLVQTVLTGLWTFWVINQSQVLKTTTKNETKIFLYKIAIAVLLFSIWIYGVYCLFHTQSFYMGLILSWALPVLILQFLIGGEHILKNLKVFLVASLTPTLYLWCADYYAISDGIWHINPKNLLGYGIGVLPIEEMAFFLITNLMVVQGLLLFLILRDTVIRVFKR